MRSQTTRVLMLDDDEGIRKAFVRTLRDTDVDVTCAATIPEATALADRSRYDIFVVDLNLGPDSGLDAITILKKIQRNAAFILITGEANYELPATGEFQDSVVAVITKPWRIKSLRKTIDRAARIATANATQDIAPRRLLLVEDSLADAELFGVYLERSKLPFAVDRVLTLGAAVERLGLKSYDVVVSDLGLPDAVGLDAVVKIRDACPAAALIVLSGRDDEALAVEAIDAGAQDYLLKSNLNDTSLKRAIPLALERIKTTKNLLDQAECDALTGLANRTRLMRRLSDARSVVSGSQVVVLYLDLDGFKEVNDTHGHDAGDAVLREVAERLRQSIRSEDTCARLGGDEFAVVFTNVNNIGQAQAAAQRIIKDIARPITWGGLELFVTASLGLAAAQSGITTDDIVKNADTAMYHAKRSGKNRMRMADNDEGPITTTIEAPRYDDRYVMHYEPVYDARGEQVMAWEALVGRFGSTSTPVSPGEFMNQLEPGEQAMALGRWFVSRACRDLSQLRLHSDPSARLSVLVSPELLREARFSVGIVTTLAFCGLTPRDLEFQLPARSLGQYNDEDLEALRLLQANGHVLCLNEFGADGISFDPLRQLPINRLKLSPELFTAQGDPRVDGAIVAGVVGIAHELHLEIIAMNVDSADERDRAQAAGVDYVQGHFLGSPIAVDALTAPLQLQRAPGQNFPCAV